MDKKTKWEQFFVLIMTSVFLFILLCASGCGGGNSCEMPKCGVECDDKVKGLGVSIPGCGGLLSSGKGFGFDTCGLWSQSIKLVGAYTIDETKTQTKDGKLHTNSDRMIILGADNRYYIKDGCGGCANNQLNACYGLAMVDSPVHFMVAVGKGAPVYTQGNTELIVGCAGGVPITCCGSPDVLRLLHSVESSLDVE